MPCRDSKRLVEGEAEPPYEGSLPGGPRSVLRNHLPRPSEGDRRGGRSPLRIHRLRAIHDALFMAV